MGMRCFVYLNGEIVQRSRNLAGIRRYVSSHLIEELHIAPKSDGQINVSSNRGWLYIVFSNGATFQTDFASYEVLKGFVSRWRNVYGAPLWMAGHPAGVVSARNPKV
jgi:hypothetical protein